jgi:hypothetical protein
LNSWTRIRDVKIRSGINISDLQHCITLNIFSIKYYKITNSVFWFLFHRKFSHTSARRDHEGGHTGEKPFRCLCGERYCTFGKNMIIQHEIIFFAPEPTWFAFYLDTNEVQIFGDIRRDAHVQKKR